MRLTSRVFAQHLDWTFKKHWQVQGKRVIRETTARAELERLGIKVKDVHDVLKKEEPREKVEVVGIKPAVLRADNTHPDWHDRVCHLYGDGNVLLEGLSQAQVLTNTVEINEFPENILEWLSKTHLTDAVHQRIRNAVMVAHAYDAEQVKLPKVKVPDRPAYNLPRSYGISTDRRVRLLFNNFMLECEKLAPASVTSQRKIIDNADFKITFDKDGELIKLDVSAEKLMTTSCPIEPLKCNYKGDLPNLHPLKFTISLPKEHIYTIEDFFAISPLQKYSHPHTIFLNFNMENVRNLHETNVTTTQFESRNMLKAFGVAASKGKQLYGDSAPEQLPKPIIVQSVQTDGRTFNFGVLQLNTLSLNSSEKVRNFWFHPPNMDLFTECGYKNGRPILQGYNRDVFRAFHAFYNNN